MDHLSDLQKHLGADMILTSQSDSSRYSIGARGDEGKAAFVMRPRTTEEVSSCVQYCIQNGISLVCQSGNTGLVGGSIPDQSGEQAVLSLECVKGVFEVDVINRSVQLGAGWRLSELNDRLQEHDLFLPIDLGADPMVGGMAATNTGGARFLRYGDMRQHILGATVVLFDEEGTIIKLGNALRKDNVMIDFKHLFVGSFGTIGVITELQLNVEPVPKQQAAALLVPSSPKAVDQLLHFLEEHAGNQLSAFELMSQNAVQYALDHTCALQNPFAGGKVPPVSLLVELTRSWDPKPWETSLDEVLQSLLAESWELEGSPLDDALLGRPEPLWSLRHALSEGVKAAGSLFAFDLSFKRSQTIAFRQWMIENLPKHFPEIEICDFGHVADGGLHFNLVCRDPNACSRTGYEKDLRDWVYRHAVEDFGASFSAEHGIGRKNQRYYDLYVPDPIKEMTAHLKEALSVMNTGAVSL